MKTLTTSIVLSVMFLSAGAFAGSSRGVHPAVMPAASPANVTIVTKNAAWPPVGQISVEPCSRARCIAI
ncbi:hypothetical protein DK847_00595 [Aestuariivirga litoralis]|uniref:Uncharacterized protein n=1 Tax=Aestuariivirga litoralis TaxID=2650924 RepID=A0A2W2BY29_9HYPH|nr:hypothetical protein [Aestuariivirga litoralis]PZF78356.1 hypothetical protein DK847_00595 [Aestuariivirga litoralis]